MLYCYVTQQFIIHQMFQNHNSCTINAAFKYSGKRPKEGRTNSQVCLRLDLLRIFCFASEGSAWLWSLFTLGLQDGRLPRWSTSSHMGCGKGGFQTYSNCRGWPCPGGCPVTTHPVTPCCSHPACCRTPPHPLKSLSPSQMTAVCKAAHPLPNKTAFSQGFEWALVCQPPFFFQ